MKKSKAQIKKTKSHLKKNRKQIFIISAILFIAVSSAGWIAFKNNEPKLSNPYSQIDTNGYPVPPGGETRPTLSPALFRGKVARAYNAAKEISEVLDQIYCYCDCELNFGHKSNLTCFVDRHGSQCDICINEALDAYHYAQNGLTVDEIKIKIDKKYGKKLKSYKKNEMMRLLSFMKDA